MYMSGKGLHVQRRAVHRFLLELQTLKLQEEITNRNKHSRAAYHYSEFTTQAPRYRLATLHNFSVAMLNSGIAAFVANEKDSVQHVAVFR